MKIKPKMGKNIIKLPELTKAALERFLADPTVSCFLTEEAKEAIREKAKGKLKDW